MSKSFELLVFFALLLSLVQSLTSFEPKKIPFNPGKIEYKSNELKNYTETIDILVNPMDNQDIVIGKEGILCLRAEYNDTKSEDIFDPKTIEEETSFQLKMLDKYQMNISATCRLWKSSERLTIFIFCDFYFHEIGDNSLTIEDQSFEYKNKYLINITFLGGKNFNVEQSDMEIPFLYSYEQNINLNQSQDSYELKFKINKYNKEILYIYGTKNNYAALENCQIYRNELTCNISKRKIEEILILKNEKFKIGAINDTLGLVQFNYVSDININSENIFKEEIYIRLTKLVGPITEAGTPFAFETDVDNIPNFTSDLISNIFYFKKMSGKPLMVFVKYPYLGENITIPSHENDTIFTNLHYKYNFRIAPFHFNETISVQNNGTNVLLAYPEEINFISNNSNAHIRYIMSVPSFAIDIKLNPDSNSSLECKNINGLKKCIVPPSHFEGKESGLYNTYHKNHANDFNIYYDAPLINITIKKEEKNDTIFYIDDEDNKNYRRIGHEGIINIVLNYNDTETNVFNALDIEEKTSFITTLLIDNSYSYNVNCKLWKPINEKLNMFCKLKEDLNIGMHNFIFNPSSFNYDGKKYNIITRGKNLMVNQLNETIPFLYSSKQILHIDENIETYYLKYKIVEYHNETLLIPGTQTGSIILDNCAIKGNELECKLDKAEIEEYIVSKEQELNIFRYRDNSNEEMTPSGLYDSNYGIYLDYHINITEVNVRITELLEKNIDNDNYLAFKTDVVNIGRVHSDSFNLSLSSGDKIECMFKKTEAIPILLMLCQVSGTNFSLFEIDKEIQLRNINIQYHFFIQPSKINDTCSIKGDGSFLMLTIPKVLDFTLKSNYTIDYSMYAPENSKGIKLNPEGDDLICKDYKNMIKKCIVTIDHFKNKQSGYYYTYHRNHLNEHIKFYEGSPIKVILPKEENITELYIEQRDNLDQIRIGYEGIIFFVINYNDNEANIFNASDIEEKTNFNTTILVDNGNLTNVNCKLWKPIDEKLNLFCKLYKNLTSGLHSIKLSPSTFYYYNQKIRIIQKVESLPLFQHYEIIPFLYSSEQTLKIEENVETYELKFKIGEYHNETLYYLGEDLDALIIEKCSVKVNELICNLDKAEIEELAVLDGQQLNLFHLMPNYSYKMFNLHTIHNIYINYPLSKKDIYVGITKLNESNIDTRIVVYETNVTNITNVNSGRFDINLSEGRGTISCHLKKTIDIPLVMYCHVNENEFFLGEIGNETVLNNINIKYNFLIQPINNTEKCSVLGNNAHILFSSTKLLDFTKQPQYTIYYAMENPTSIRGIKLNPEANDLYCEDIDNALKKCIVTEDHFLNKKSGYYYTHHTNQVNKSIIFFEASPIKVIISENDDDIHIKIKKEDNEDKIKIGNKGVFALVTNYNDKDKKIFDDNYKNIKFNVNLRDNSGSNNYNVSCKLWVPNDDNLRIICQFDEYLSNSTLSLYLDKYNLVYNNHSIYFEQNEPIIFERYYDFIPFLYSDKQTIYVNENQTTYELKFKIETYNKNILYIQGSNDNYAILDNCQIKDETGELICSIKKEEIEKILVNQNEQFKIGAINDTVGLIPFEHILNIIIYYENVQKEDIFIEMKGIIDGTTDLGTPLAILTNITNIPEFISGKFEDKIYFKKISGKPLMIFYYYPEEIEGRIKMFDYKPIAINDSHYKYNFIIPSPSLEDYLSIRGNGTNILLTYPLELNYTSENRLPIRYIMKESPFSKNIKLNPNSKNALDCENLYKMKICYVPMEHFAGKKSNVYDTYYLNHKNNFSIYYNSPSINVTLPYNIIEININQEDNEDEISVGDKGMFYLKTDYNDKDVNIFSDISIEERTKFTTSIITEERRFENVNCHLWKNSKGIIYVFCKLNENLEYDHQNIKINGGSFNYDEYKVNIVSRLDHVYTEQLNVPMPFLYAKNQTINIQENKDTYYLKFFIGYYYNEKLFILGNGVEHMIFDKCSIEKNEIICNLTKTELEEISYNKIKFYAYYPHYGIGMLPFPMVEDLDIKYTLLKIDLNIKIKNLVENDFDSNNFFAYEVESNIENTTNLMTEMFNVTFENEDKNEAEGQCFFKKVNDNPLYLLCKVEGEKDICFLNIKKELKLNNIHIKYNFNIASIKYEGKINIKWEGSYAIMAMEKTLDLYNNDEITVDFIFEQAKNINYMTFNSKKGNLDCTNIESNIKRCVITKTHFKNETSGYYYLNHLNHMKNYIKFYELSPIQVILPKNNEVPLRIEKENNKNGVKIGKNGIFALTTSFDEKEKKEVFNKTDIKDIEEIKISTKIKDDNNNEYKANCRLWVPTEDKIRIICKLEDNLKNKKQNIIIEQISFEYLEYEITIIQLDYIEANQYNYDIPFLYSGKTTININLNESNYILKFNIESYNKELLYIYGDALNYDILDNCKDDNKELTCTISLQKIEGILTLNKTTFKIGAIHDNIGIIPLDNILEITIIYPQIAKENIIIDEFNVINSNTEMGVYFGFEKNINNLNGININSIQIELGVKCYFRKKGENPFMLLCLSDEEDEFEFPTVPRDIIYERVHYKYNFIIKAYSNIYKFNIKDSGTDIKLTYPEKLDFNSTDSLTIRYIMTNPSLAKNIKLNPTSSDLTCEDLEGMKKCILNKDHFIGNQTGIYRTLHSNHLGELASYYESSNIEVILPKEEIVEILVSDEENKQEIDIGDKGIIYFITKYKDEQNIFNAEDITEKTEFITSITDKNSNNYNVTCRLWKPVDENMRIFCKLNINIAYPYIKLDSVSFMYNKHKISIISHMIFGMKINQLNSQIPFIYSDKHIIEVEKSKDSYEIKLKYLEYYNEQLILMNIPKIGEEEELNNMILDKCDLKDKDLICKLSRENIEQILGYSGQEFKILYLDKNRGLLGSMNNLLNIKFNHNSIQKENVYIGLTKLLDNKISVNNYFAYETNVTNINTIITNKFIYQNIYCLMKKDPEKALIVICKYNSNDTIHVGQIKEEIKLTDINIKYNLLVQPRETEDELIISGNSGNILFANPMTLDFNLNEHFTLNYYINNFTYYNTIKLNPDSNKDLICDSHVNLVTCNVNKSHFEGYNSGYYYTYHKNNFDGYSISYELSPIKVIIPPSDEIIIRINNIDEKNPIKIGQKGAIAFITDFEDTQNIFDESEIETQMINNIPFSSDNKNYMANCHLWKPKGEKEKLRLICKFNENIDTQKIKLNKYNFDYKQKKIALISQNDLNINQLNSNISFLYSDKQIINITDNTNEYYLIFKKEIYNKEPLILYKEDNTMKNVYLNCAEENEKKEIKCTVTKDKLVGILSKDGEKFSLAQLTESEGMLKFDNVFDIEINYPNVVKINVNLVIIKLLTLTVEKNNFIVFQVNTTEVIQIFISDYFNIVPNRNDETKCFFKKNSDEKDDKSLLLLCKADSSGEFKLDTSALNLDEINILYSFSIPETHINETAKISNEEGPKILSVYPNSLNFTSNDKLILKYQVENPEKLTGVKLNPNSTTELQCINKNNIKECTVPKTHFTESGSYYTYYDNSLGTKSISYEISKIDITLNKDNGKKETEPGNNLAIIIGPVVGGIVLIVIIVIVVIYCKRKHNDDSEFKNKTGNINSAVELIEGDKFGDE